MNKDQIKGKFDQAVGAVKDKVGEIKEDHKTQSEGKLDQAKGEIREQYGKAKEGTQNLKENVKENVRDTLDKGFSEHKKAV